MVPHGESLQRRRQTLRRLGLGLARVFRGPARPSRPLLRSLLLLLLLLLLGCLGDLCIVVVVVFHRRLSDSRLRRELPPYLLRGFAPVTILGFLATRRGVVRGVMTRGLSRPASGSRGRRERVRVLPLVHPLVLVLVHVVAIFLDVFPDVVASREPGAAGHGGREGGRARGRSRVDPRGRERRGLGPHVRGDDAHVPLDVAGSTQRRRSLELATDAGIVHAREPSGVAERSSQRRARIVYGRVNIHRDIRGSTCVVEEGAGEEGIGRAAGRENAIDKCRGGGGARI